MKKNKIYILLLVLTYSFQLIAQNDCATQLRVFNQQTSPRLLNFQKFSRFFPIERNSIASYEPDILKVYLEIMNLKEETNRYHIFADDSLKSIKDVIELIQFKVLSSERRLVALNRFLPEAFRPKNPIQFLTENEMFNLNDLKSRYGKLNLNSDEGISILGKINDKVTIHASSRASEIAVMLTKRKYSDEFKPRRSIHIIELSNIKGNEIRFNHGFRAYAEDHGIDTIHQDFIQKEIDVLSSSERTWSEIKLLSHPVILSDVLAQMSNLVLLKNFLNAGFKDELGNVIVQPVDAIELYAINGITFQAAKKLESMGITVYGERF